VLAWFMHTIPQILTICMLESSYPLLLTCDLCQQFYRIWHLTCSRFACMLDLCIQFFRLWQSASSSLCIHFNSDAICVSSSIDSDILQFSDFDAMSICAYSSIDSDILHLGVFISSSTRSSTSTQRGSKRITRRNL